MGTNSVISFIDRTAGLADVLSGERIDRTSRRIRQLRDDAAPFAVVAGDEESDGEVDPDLEVAIFDAP